MACEDTEEWLKMCWKTWQSIWEEKSMSCFWQSSFHQCQSPPHAAWRAIWTEFCVEKVTQDSQEITGTGVGWWICLEKTLGQPAAITPGWAGWSSAPLGSHLWAKRKQEASGNTPLSCSPRTCPHHGRLYIPGVSWERAESSSSPRENVGWAVSL